MIEIYIDVYEGGSGLCYLSVCSNEPIAETIAKANYEFPTGLHQRSWRLSPDERFKSGAPNPCPCNLHPDTHKHYLLEC